MLSACSSPENKTDQQQELEHKIAEMRDSLSGNDALLEYIALVDTVSNSYTPDTSFAPDLIEAAKICTRLQDYPKAIEFRKRFIELYPQAAEVPEMLFAVGFSYNNDVNNLDSAKKYLEIMVVDYPNHKLTEFAQFELNNLGKSPDDIVNEFKKQNNME